MKLKWFAALSSLLSAAVGFAGETQQGDITAAVRAAGGTTTVSASHESAGNLATVLSDGKLTGNRYLSNATEGPVTFQLDLPSAFLPGEDVVVTGIAFFVGATYSNYKTRVPKSWTLNGSNDGSTWTKISEVGGFAAYAEDSAEGIYSGSFPFVNWTSYRHYQLVVTKNAGATDYFLQLGEIALYGLYGGTVVQPEPEFVDITAEVRAAKEQTVEVNAGMAAAATSPDKLVDGLYGFNNNRYLSDATTTTALWQGGGSVNVDYTIGDKYANGADVIVTGYAFDVDWQHGYSLERLPRDWKIQGWDGAVWKTIDSICGFVDWQIAQRANEADGVEHPHYTATFSCTNSTPYRKYRLSVSQVNKSGSQLQLTEFQLFGYVDADIAGKVGLATEGNDIDIVQCGIPRGFFAPELSSSEYDRTEGLFTGSVTNLFDANHGIAFLARMGADGDEARFVPLTLGYGIPSDYLPGKEIVLKHYALVSKDNGLSQYQARAPKTWTLEGLAEDGRWIKIDRRKDFADWQDDAETHRYYAAFDLPDNKLAFRQYRFRFYEPTATSAYQGRSGMNQILLYDIEMSGKWGTGISEPPPERKGLLLMFK